MTMRVVTDSTCDLPPELISKYGITVVPMTINVDSKGNLDGVELTRDDFYENLPEYSTHPTTGTQSPDAFQRVYERLAAEGATEILSIHVSSSLSAVFDAARLGAIQTAAIPVTVVDSRQLSLGTGFAVLAAAKASVEGHSMSQILSLIDEQISRTHVFAALDTLVFLRRSGRMNGILTGLGQHIAT
jgi:DegV family protein with EDD domain